jgi:hypothetical protein
MKNILLQTTIEYALDDWSIKRFSILTDVLSSIEDPSGRKLFHITARDRENLASGDDRLLSKIDESDFDQIWLFGVDVGGGMSPQDCAAVGRFRQRGGAIFTSRDHQDLGISFCDLGGIGAANHFHTKNPEFDPQRRMPDDTETPTISWPNYHSGTNGDFQLVEAVLPLHPVMTNSQNPSGRIERLPAHPHEGAISVPPGERWPRVVAVGRSAITSNAFNIAIAFESENLGRAVVDSSFHHFADFNFDPRLGCPSFVTEPRGYALMENEAAVTDAKAYARNIASWLSNELTELRSAHRG